MKTVCRTILLNYHLEKTETSVTQITFFKSMARAKGCSLTGAGNCSINAMLFIGGCAPGLARK
jgi:hypothetical protein